LSNTEQEILSKIKEIQVEQNDARCSVALHKKAAVEAESRLIAANLQLDKLNEQLRLARLRNPIQEETTREKDIREFKDRLPEILKKI